MDTLKPMTPFDELITSSDIQMLKIFLPYVPPSGQKFLGIFIKISELKETINLFFDMNNEPYSKGLCNCCKTSYEDLMQSIKPYLPASKAQAAETICRLLHRIESGNSFTPMEMVMDMFSDSQKELFNMYSSMFNTNIERS